MPRLCRKTWRSTRTRYKCYSSFHGHSTSSKQARSQVSRQTIDDEAQDDIIKNDRPWTYCKTRWLKPDRISGQTHMQATWESITITCHQKPRGCPSKEPSRGPYYEIVEQCLVPPESSIFSVNERKRRESKIHWRESKIHKQGSKIL